MTTKDNGGPAFPVQAQSWSHGNGGGFTSPQNGMTLRSYAAIHLRVPQSEHEWLNDMIREAQRNAIAEHAMPVFLEAANDFNNTSADGESFITFDEVARDAARLARSVLADREGSC
jgi:hypothetical protein